MNREGLIADCLSKTTEDKATGCLLWTGYKTPGGYGRISFEGELVLITRLILGIEGDRRRGAVGILALHKCHRPACINPKHLYVGTQRENIRDSYRHGTGIRAGWYEDALTPSKIEDILYLYVQRGVAANKVAGIYDISVNVVRRLASDLKGNGHKLDPVRVGQIKTALIGKKYGDVKRLAAEYGVSVSMIQKIRDGSVWGWVRGD